METSSTERPGVRRRTYSVRSFMSRMSITLAVLVAASLAVIFILVYLPFKAELEKSLLDNFSQLSYIRYASLQNSLERGLEGARSMSSRTVIRNAILDYKNGDIDMDELVAITQSKYEDGAKALEYLLKAERFVDGLLVASYTEEGFQEQSCTFWNGLTETDEMSSALCLTDGHEYFVIRSPILSEKQVIGYDQLIFDLSDQIQAFSTETIKSELVDQDKLDALSLGARVLKNSDVSSLFYKDGFYYRVFHMQGDAHFISGQNEHFLLKPVFRLSKQILSAGSAVLLIFALTIYFFVIRHAKSELEDSRFTAKEAMSEANTDSLTKAGSRRLGEELLSAAFARFQNGETSPAFLMFDIDSLKQINDVYGHSVGDRVICSIAKAVQINIRGADVLLRWGGDEFIGIFNGLSKENVMPLAQKLLHAVSDLRIETGSGVIKPTVSIGISYFREEDCGFIDVINRADRAMYQSKAEGRNRAHEL